MLKSRESPKRLWESINIFEILWKRRKSIRLVGESSQECVKNNKNLERPRGQPGIKQRFLWEQQVLPHRVVPSKLSAPPNKPDMPSNSQPASQPASRATSQVFVVAREPKWNRSSKNRSLQACRVWVSFFQGQQFHLRGVLTSYPRGIECWRGRRQRR